MFSQLVILIQLANLLAMFIRLASQLLTQHILTYLRKYVLSTSLPAYLPTIHLPMSYLATIYLLFNKVTYLCPTYYLPKLPFTYYLLKLHIFLPTYLRLTYILSTYYLSKLFIYLPTDLRPTYILSIYYLPKLPIYLPTYLCPTYLLYAYYLPIQLLNYEKIEVQLNMLNTFGIILFLQSIVVV